MRRTAPIEQVGGGGDVTFSICEKIAETKRAVRDAQLDVVWGFGTVTQLELAKELLSALERERPPAKKKTE